MKWLITGGAGFIGSNLIEALLAKDESVIVIDDLSTGSKDNIEPFLDRITFHEGSILDDALLAKALAGVDVILHQAAIPSVPRSVKDPLATHEAIVTGTLKILQAAREKGINRVVIASSSSVYGDTPTLPKEESMVPHPLSPYAVAKLAIEGYSRVFHELFGMDTVCLRYFNVFGPRQDPDSEYSAVIPKFIKALQMDERPIIYGDGSQSRDFTYITNVVDANFLAAKADGVGGMVFNIAAGDQITVKDLAERLAKLLGKDISPKLGDERPGDIRHSFADITHAKEKLGFSISVDFDEGLKRTLEWFS